MTQLTRFVLLPALVGAVVGLAILFFNGERGTAASDKPGFAAAVVRAAPAVVNIYTTKITRRGLLCSIPAYASLCASLVEEPQVQNSLGSGVIVRPDGYVLTNGHVVAGADEILVMFANNQARAAEVVGVDPHTDLAVIKVPERGLPVIDTNTGETVQVGDVALAIGNPFGLGHSVSQGIISALSRDLITNSPYDDFIQTDAAISPGNSGGALVDHEGRLLGINTMIYSQSGGSEGIGFAIPTELALWVVEQIVTNGRVIRGWLGVSLTPLPQPEDPSGLLVTAVHPGGPAAQAGLQRNDIITSVNRLPAVNAHAITDVIALTTPGGFIDLEVKRSGNLFRARAIAGELPPRS